MRRQPNRAALRRSLALLGLGMIVVATTTSTAAAESTAELIKRGVVTLESGDPRSARELFSESRRALPGWYLGHLYWGIAESRISPGSAAALEAFVRAAELVPANPRCRYHLGVALNGAGRFDAAETALRRAIELRPGIRDAQYQLGLAVRGQGRHREAITELERARALGPRHVATYLVLANLYEHQGEPGAAERTLRRLAGLSPEASEDGYRLVRFFERLGGEELAEAERRRLAGLGIPLPPDHAMIAQGRALLASGELEPARALFAELRGRHPDWYAPAYYSALAEIQNHPFSEPARAALARAVELAPLHPLCHYQLGLALRGSGRPREVETHLRRALELRPEIRGARFEIGLALRAQGKTAEALTALEGALVESPEHPGTLAALAELYEQGSRFVEAEAALRTLTGAPGTNGDYTFRLLELLERLGAEPEAARERRRLEGLEPTLPEERVLLWSGTEALAAGEFERARGLFAQVRDRDPGWFMAHLYWGVAEAAMVPGSDAALAALERAIELVPYNAASHYQIGVIHLQAKRPARAEASLRRAIGLRPGIQDARFRLALMLREQNHHADALTELERARSENPDHLATLATLAEIYEGQERFAEAEEALRQITHVQPNVAYHFYRLAELLDRAGRASEARRVRRQLERIDPRPKRRMRPLPPARN